MPVPPAHDTWGRLRTPSQEEEARARAVGDPGGYHGNIAAGELHWYDGERRAWLTRNPSSGSWEGFSAEDGTPLDTGLPGGEWRPWGQAFDDGQGPFYRWFVGARTNARERPSCRYSRRAVLAFIWACRSLWARTGLATTMAPVVSLSSR